MKTSARTILRPYLARSLAAALLTALVALLATASAQEYVYGNDYDFEAVRPYGAFETVYEAYDNVDFGALILTHSTPDDQHANFDVVGPNDYHAHFDFSDDPGEEYVLDDLQPGTYSIAATDETFELAHTVVEVRLGEIVRVNIDMQIREQAFAAGTYRAADYYGTYAGFEDRYPGYPYGAYGVGPYEAYDNAEFGAFRIEGLDAEFGDDLDMTVVVTGPDGYSETFEGDAFVEGLPAGVYAVAATGLGMDVSVTTFEIQAGQQLPLRPSFVNYQGTTADAVGAGDATANEAAVPETAATPDISPAIPNSAIGMNMYQSWDADRDSLVSEEEFRTGAFTTLAGDDDMIDSAEFERVQLIGTGFGLDTSADFATLDANGDALLDRAEFEQAYDASAFNAWDMNGDGQIDTGEYHRGWFTTLDANGDTRLNEAEYSPFENWFGRAWAEFEAGVEGLTEQDWLTREF